jgi:hypothetical protein
MRVDRGIASIAVTDPPACWARTVRTEEAILRAINGSFPIKEALKVVKEVILPRGYQSRISRTTGRLTAIGLLRRARIKKPRAESRGPGA